MANSKALVIQSGILKQIPDADTLIVSAGIRSATGSALTVTADTGSITMASATSFSSTASVTGVLSPDGGVERTTSAALNIATANAGNVTAVNIGTGSVVGSIIISRSGQLTTIAGDLSVSGTETVVGASTFNSTVTIGDGVGGPDTLEFNATTGRLSSVALPNVLWLKEINHIFRVDDSTTVSTVGGNLTVRSGAGSAGTGATAGAVGGTMTESAGTGGAGGTSGVGGAGGSNSLTGGVGGIAGSTTGVAGAGGALTITGGLGGAAAAGTGAGGVGGVLTVSSGTGGAGTATGTAGAGAAFSINGGAAGADGGAGGASGGNVNILGGAATGAGINGTVNIGTSSTSAIAIGASGITTSLTGTHQVTAGSIINTTGTGNINLPNNASARFQIEGVAVTSTVIAVNLTTLTNGSNADALHTHAGLGTVSATSGEALTAGNLVAIQNVAGTPKVFKADANGAAPLPNAIGITNTTAGAADVAITLSVSGQVDTADAVWDSFPVVADVGKRAYLSGTSGNWKIGRAHV